MVLLISLVVANVSFLLFLQVFYVIVARRRWRIYMLVEHLAALVRNGLPVHAGLRVIGKDLGGFLGSRLGRVAEGLEQGRPIGDAFEAAPRAFPSLLRSMLSLGDRCGNLAGCLEELRRSYKRIADLPHQSLYMFFYPLLLSIGINAALTGIYFGMVSKFESIFQQLGVQSGGYKSRWSQLLLANEVVLALCVAMFVFFILGGSSIHFGTSILRRLKGVADWIVLRLPIFGRMARDGAIQQFALCTSLVLRSGGTLPEAVVAAAREERNGPLRRRLERVARAVEEGTRLSSAAREEGVGEADFVWFLETGEASGLLAEHLALAATHYETKVRLAHRLATRAVVPSFVLLNGVIVGAALLLIFVPIQKILRGVLRE